MCLTNIQNEMFGFPRVFELFEVFADTWAAESNACSSLYIGTEETCYNIIIYTSDCRGGRGSPTWTHGPCTYNSTNS